LPRRIFINNHSGEQAETVSQFSVHGPPFIITGATLLPLVAAHLAIDRHRLRGDGQVTDESLVGCDGVGVRSTHSHFDPPDWDYK